MYGQLYSIVFLLLLLGYGQIGYYCSVWCHTVKRLLTESDEEEDLGHFGLQNAVHAWNEAQNDREVSNNQIQRPQPNRIRILPEDIAKFVEMKLPSVIIPPSEKGKVLDELD